MKKIISLLLCILIVLPSIAFTSADSVTLNSVFWDIDNENRIIYIDKEVAAEWFLKSIVCENGSNLVVLNANGDELTATSTVRSGYILYAGAVRYTISNATLKVFGDDFDFYEEGELSSNNNWSVNAKTEVGGSIEVVNKNEKKYCETKVSYVKNATAKDSYLQTKGADMSKKTVISLSIINNRPAQGTVDVLLRSDQGNESPANGRFSIVRIGSTGIRYLPSSLNVTETATGWQNLKIILDSGTLSIYNNDILKVSADISSIDNGKYTDFNFERCSLRIYTERTSNSSDAYAETGIDDIRLYNEIGTDSNLLISPSEFAGEYEERKFFINSLSDGVITTKNYYDSFSGTDRSVGVFVTHTGNEGIKNISYSESRVIGKRGTVEGRINISGVSENDNVSVYLFDTKTFQPIGRTSIMEKEKIDIPNETAVLKDFGITGNKHPRIMANGEDFSRILNEVDSNKYMKEFKSSTIAAADRIIEKSIDDTDKYDTPEEKYNIQYLIPDGLRLLTMSRRVLDFVSKLSMSYKLTGEEKYAEKVWKILERAGIGYDDNPPFPNWNSDKHFLDTAEMTAAFSIGYDWCFDYFTDEQKDYIVESIKTYGLETAIPYYEKKTGWTQETNNWNTVCNGGMVLGAVAVMDVYPELAAYIVSNAIDCIQNQLVYFAPDGGWVEGTGYWYYTMRYLSKMETTLRKGLGTDYGIMNIPGLDRTGDFIIHMQGPKGTNNYSDTSMQKLYPPELYWLAGVYGNKGLAEVCITNNKDGGPFGLLWFDTDVKEGEIELEKDFFFRGVNAVSLRESWDENATFLSFHGGKSVAAHSHIDCGTFVLDSMGERWAYDLPAEDYNVGKYFVSTNENRFSYYRARAEGHNVYVVNPDLTGGQDLDADTPVTKFVSEYDKAYAVLDLKSAYKETVNRAERGFRLTNNRKCAVVRDEISLKSDSSELYWFMHTKADARVNGDTVILAQNGKTMNVKFTVEGGNYEISVVKAKPLPTSPVRENQSTNDAFKKIQVKVQNGTKIKINAEFIPSDGNNYISENEDISEW